MHAASKSWRMPSNNLDTRQHSCKVFFNFLIWIYVKLQKFDKIFIFLILFAYKNFEFWCVIFSIFFHAYIFKILFFIFEIMSCLVFFKNVSSIVSSSKYLFVCVQRITKRFSSESSISRTGRSGRKLSARRKRRSKLSAYVNRDDLSRIIISCFSIMIEN